MPDPQPVQPPSTWKHQALATAIIVGLIGFTWPFADFLSKISTDEIMWNPPTYGQILRCMCFGLLAFACALGLNVGQALKGAIETGKMVLGAFSGTPTKD